MEPFASLEPELRAYALVGYYLNGWGAMESALNRCIGNALKLDFTQGVIVTHNLQFRNKLKILRTLINEAVSKDDDRRRYDKFAISVGDMSDDRNMVAHEWFGPCEKTGGVRFFVTKAHGKLNFPEVRWSMDDTHGKFSELLDASRRLKALDAFFSHSEAIKTIMKALMERKDEEAPQPMAGLFGLGRGLLVDLPNQSDPNSDLLSTIRSINSETPEPPLK